MKLCSYDIDGVIFNGPGRPGLTPGKKDIIITGRSIEEREETIKMLDSRNIYNIVFFNPIPYEAKTRESSGLHKATVLNIMTDVVFHYEDDPVQAEIIRSLCPHITVMLIDNPLVDKENRRHYDY